MVFEIFGFCRVKITMVIYSPEKAKEREKFSPIFWVQDSTTIECMKDSWGFNQSLNIKEITNKLRDRGKEENLREEKERENNINRDSWTNWYIERERDRER